ncbi:DUF2809 domain-containing protein [Microbacterium sp. NPDC090218]
MRKDAAGSATRRRIALGALALVTVAIGLLVHRGVGGTIGDIAGDALYAALIYLLVAVVAPRWHRLAVGAAAVAFCGGVELLQLTGLPREWAAAFPPLELVLGSGFDARDLVVYAVAVTVAALLDATVTVAVTGTRTGNATGRPPEGERPV